MLSFSAFLFISMISFQFFMYFFGHLSETRFIQKKFVSNDRTRKTFSSVALHTNGVQWSNLSRTVRHVDRVETKPRVPFNVHFQVGSDEHGFPLSLHNSRLVRFRTEFNQALTEPLYSRAIGRNKYRCIQPPLPHEIMSFF